MTSAQVVEASVANNSSFQNYTHPDDHTIRTTDTPGFKPFTLIVNCFHLNPAMISELACLPTEYRITIKKKHSCNISFTAFCILVLLLYYTFQELQYKHEHEE